MLENVSLQRSVTHQNNGLLQKQAQHCLTTLTAPNTSKPELKSFTNPKMDRPFSYELSKMWKGQLCPVKMALLKRSMTTLQQRASTLSLPDLSWL